MRKIKGILRYDFRKYIDVLIFITLINCGALLMRSSFIINDGYWHIKCGEYLVSNIKNVLDIKCIGSWTIPNEQGLTTEWLFEIILYYINSISDTAMCSFMIGLYYITTLLTVRFILKARKVAYSQRVFYNCIVNGIAIVICGVGQARPQQFTLLFIVLFITIIEKSLEKDRELLLLWLLPITVLWANIHGGTSMIAYAIMIVYIIMSSFNKQLGNIVAKRERKSWLIVAIITLVGILVAICINPAGYRLLFHAFSNMGDKTMIHMIMEWMAPDAKSIGTVVMYYLPMSLGIVALIHSKDTINARDMVLWFMFIYLFLRSQRFASFMLITEVMLISKYAFKLFNFDKSQSNKISIQDSIAAWIFIIGNIIILCMTVTNKIPIDRLSDETIISDELLADIKETNPKRLYNTYNTGGYLVYNDIDVFIDGRYEPYRKNGIVQDYFLLNAGNTENYELGSIKLEEYNFDYLLIGDSDIALYSRLNNNSNYKLISRDSNYLYYKNLCYKEQ